MIKLRAAFLFATAIFIPGAANAAILKYVAPLTDINNLGASGTAFLTHDTATNELIVSINAEGLDPGIHVQHIHGLVDPERDSTTPTMAQDTDGDGFIELAEGLATYGPILLSLSSPPGLDPLGSQGGFPTTSSFMFEETYDLDDPIFAASFDVTDVLPLFFREIVIHGARLAEGEGANGGEADGTAGFKASLPVLSGEIRPIPLPGAAVLLLSGLVGGGLLGRKRRTEAASA